jgi:sugar lactone lactonase YvrE
MTLLGCQLLPCLAYSQATPTITWPTPSPITYGVALDGTQLNASANVAGTFSYSPSAGTVLLPGPQTLTATFTPTDTTNYTTASTSVSLTVLAIPPAGIITSFAGTPGWGYAGDGGPAVSATMTNVDGVAVDSAGNLYIADLQNSVIRKVFASNGKISTIAGTGTAGYTGDGGPAINAQISWPRGICVDRSGKIFFADNGNDVIREIDASGIITTVAGDGTGNWGYSGDGGPAASARLSGATDVRVDSAGNLYIADPYNMRVRKVWAATHVITTIAGNGTAGYSGDNGPATSAELYWPYGVAVDSVGNVYIADMNNNVVRRVDAATGTITPVAGNRTQGYSGDTQSATSAELNNPLGVTIDAAGNLYISDSGNNVVRKVAAGTGIITTIAGNGTLGWSGDGGPAIDAELFTPWGLATDSAGNLYIADSGSDRVRVVGSSVTEPVTTTPTITWANPTSIFYGTALSATQLNATPWYLPD